MPIMSNVGDNHDISNVRIWARIVVATSEPIITASAAAKGTALFLTNEIRSNAVAVELCTKHVTPTPEPKAMKRFLVPLRTARRSDVPYARVKPSLTLRVPHRRRHTAPAI